MNKFLQSMLNEASLKEARVFDENFELSVDPDKLDTYDLRDNLLTLVAMMGYKALVQDRESHERKFGPKSSDPEDYNFQFTKEEWQLRVDEILRDLAGQLNTIPDKKIKDEINEVAKKYKLEVDK